MNKRLIAARLLVALGCLLVLAGAALHTKFGYPTITAALAPSNLSAEMQEVVRAVFLLIACNWVIIAIVAAVAAFTAPKPAKPSCSSAAWVSSCKSPSGSQSWAGSQATNFSSSPAC